nr:(2,3-dihydroxybenzoyl)adenylate synthase [Kibdelosporangium sp. MJ126-NF4]CEL19999.1 2,3-dihydroxybenzoate-AMP ligase [Kibdelosporangium sp. MJ126-NF4]CTQ97223.1 2,3-dihydroxybenzoate-AMP ligase (EC 2.7.7.58) [Kibdelosporangium sp. MJ126-NF4]
MTDFVAWPPEFAERYRDLGYWRGQTLGDFLAERAATYGSRTAVVGGEHRWTYRELDERATRMAHGLLALGIGKGDRVVVQLPNVAEFFEVVFGLFRIGALPVFALPAHRFSEIEYFCRFTEASAYVIADRFGGFDYRTLAARIPDLPLVLVAGEPGEFRALDTVPTAGSGPLPEVSADEVAFLNLSGGSTGVPKLIPRTHDDYLYSVRESADICGLGGESVYLATLPVSHNFTLSSPGVLGALHAGSRIVLTPAPSPDVAFPLIERERVTITGVVPPIALLWMDSPARKRYDLSSMEVLQVGGARLADEAAGRVGTELGCRLQQVFGMAEGLVNYTRDDDPPELVTTTQGTPISPHDEIRIVDHDDVEVAPGEVGQLLTRGPYTIRGYYRAEAHNATAFTADGFYRTGDLVRVLPSGHIIVSGRVKDQINRGGEKVAAEEVENHLLAHDGVHDAVLVGIDDPQLGEKTCAFVIPRSPEPSAAELRKFLRERGLAAFKIPDRIELVDEFPYTGVGKTSRRALAQAIKEGLEAR